MAEKKQKNKKIEEKDLFDKLNSFGDRYDTAQVFSDFISIAAYSISNAVDAIHREEREKEYLSITGKYTKEELDIFAECFAYLVLIADEYALTCGPKDILGNIMEQLNLTSFRSGQFFTPDHVCEMMAKMMMQNPDKCIEEKKYITTCDPCVGSGRMIFGMAKALKDENYNYCSQMVVMAADIDLRCAMMTYVQLSLYGIPAIVKHQDSLLMETYSRWYTPIYLLNKWCWRETFVESAEDRKEIEMFRLASEPMYALLRSTCGYGDGMKMETLKEIQQDKEFFELHFDFDFRNPEQMKLG